MEEQLNKVELLGTVGSIGVTKVGYGRIARFSVATNYCYKSKDGIPVIETTWHTCVVSEGSKVDLDKIQKGSQVRLSGRLRAQRYIDQNGHERQSFEVVVSELTVLED